MLKKLNQRTQKYEIKSLVVDIAWEWIALLSERVGRNSTRGLPGLLTELYKIDPCSEFLAISMRFLYPLVKMAPLKYKRMI